MSNIKEVLYELIPEDVYSLKDAGEYYFHTNTLSIDPMFQETYEEYEKKHISIRNRIIRDSIDSGTEIYHPKMNTIIFGISAIKQQPIIVVEI